MKPTAIVIPCYNEASRLDTGALARFAGRRPEVRLLLVNDGSQDDTLAVLSQLQRLVPHRISVLDLPRNCGKGEAVRRGMLAVLAGDVHSVGFWDADLATPLEAIPRFREVLDARAATNLVIGARIPLLGHDVERRRLRYLMGRGFAALASCALGCRVYDTQCGAKLFRATAATEQLFAAPFQSRWFFDVEILARVRQRAQQTFAEYVYELPLAEWRDVAGSKLKTADTFRALRDLWSVFYRYRWRRGEVPHAISPSAAPTAGVALEEKKAA